jgi:hypothetical protein
MWFQRRSVDLAQADADFASGKLPGVSGSKRLLTLRTVLRLGAAASLVLRGVEISDAYAVAAEWTHYGEEGREPAALYGDGAWTALVHYGGRQGKVTRLHRSRGASTLALEFADLFPPGLAEPAAPAIVFLNRIDKAVRTTCAAGLRRGGGDGRQSQEG